MAVDLSNIVDQQSEAGVIATILYHPDFILSVDSLKPGYFYDVSNGCWYWAVEELQRNGIDTIDAFNLTNVINGNQAVKRKMAEYNINSVQEFIDMSKYAARHSIEEYKLLVNNVITMAFKRDMAKFAIELQDACGNSTVDLGKLNTLVNDGITKVTGKYVLGSDSVLFGTKIDDLWDSICSKRNADGTYGIPSCIPIFNDYFTFAYGELILLKARMKRGKSAYFLNEAIHKLKSGVPTLYIDTEMTDEQFFKRLLANLSGVEIKRIENGKYSEEEAKKLQTAKEWIKKSQLVHEYIPDKEYNDAQIEALCKKWKYKINLQFVIYDYIKFDSDATAAEVSNQLGHITNHLKNTIAGKLELAVLAGAQLNRDDKVADSDKIERYISTSIWWREKTAEELQRDGLDCGNFCARVELNRNGAQMMEDEYVDIAFDGSKMRIRQAKQHKSDTNPFSG